MSVMPPLPVLDLRRGVVVGQFVFGERAEEIAGGYNGDRHRMVSRDSINEGALAVQLGQVCADLAAVGGHWQEPSSSSRYVPNSGCTEIRTGAGSGMGGRRARAAITDPSRRSIRDRTGRRPWRVAHQPIHAAGGPVERRARHRAGRRLGAALALLHAALVGDLGRVSGVLGAMAGRAPDGAVIERRAPAHRVGQDVGELVVARVEGARAVVALRVDALAATLGAPERGLADAAGKVHPEGAHRHALTVARRARRVGAVRTSSAHIATAAVCRSAKTGSTTTSLT